MFEIILFVGLIIDGTFGRNSMQGFERSPHALRFLENGKVATRPAGSAVLNPRQMLAALRHIRARCIGDPQRLRIL